MTLPWRCLPLFVVKKQPAGRCLEDTRAGLSLRPPCVPAGIAQPALSSPSHGDPLCPSAGEGRGLACRTDQETNQAQRPSAALLGVGHSCL